MWVCPLCFRVRKGDSMAVKYKNHSGTTNQQISEREIAHSRFARKAAAEGMVLLKNEGLLPFSSSMPIALFGG